MGAMSFLLTVLRLPSALRVVRFAPFVIVPLAALLTVPYGMYLTLTPSHIIDTLIGPRCTSQPKGDTAVSIEFFVIFVIVILIHFEVLRRLNVPGSVLKRSTRDAFMYIAAFFFSFGVFI